MTTETTETKIIFQFLKAEDGKRSKPFEMSLDKLAEVLQEPEHAPNGDDFLLPIMTIEGEQTQISEAPIITVKRFLSMYNSELLNENKETENV